jgi:2-polyprenyl-3-methyl-5-hydroxy-6-metoxy-1,4-benzoquinol methylase
LCGGQQHRPIFTEFGIDILRCQNCGHVFSSSPAEPHYTEFWGTEVPDTEHFYWSKARARMHSDFFKKFLVGRSGRLLDMGSGLGFFLKAVARYVTWDAYGCEISPAAVAYARQKLGLQNVICSQLDKANLPQASFDIITMWDVLDHILWPDPVLRHCHALLKEGGILFLRLPNIDVHLPRARIKKLFYGIRPGSYYLQGFDHPHQYSMRSIRTLLKRNGFVDVQFEHLHPIEGDHPRVLVRFGKNLCFEIVRALALASRGRLNFDNLFVVAQKQGN